jgi:glutamate 5-kinase
MIRHLSKIDQRLFEASDPSLGKLSRGGIRSKLKTATGALTANISMVLANGLEWSAVVQEKPTVLLLLAHHFLPTAVF